MEEAPMKIFFLKDKNKKKQFSPQMQGIHENEDRKEKDSTHPLYPQHLWRKKVLVLILMLVASGLAMADDEISFYEGPRNALSTDDTQENPNVDYNRAFKLFQQKNYAKAQPLFQNEIHDHPADARAYYFLARCLQEAGDNLGAAVGYLRSDRLKPSPVTHAAAQRELARLSEKERDKALQTLKKDCP